MHERMASVQPLDMKRRNPTRETPTTAIDTLASMDCNQCICREITLGLKDANVQDTQGWVAPTCVRRDASRETDRPESTHQGRHVTG